MEFPGHDQWISFENKFPEMPISHLKFKFQGKDPIQISNVKILLPTAILRFVETLEVKPNTENFMAIGMFTMKKTNVAI